MECELEITADGVAGDAPVTAPQPCIVVRNAGVTYNTRRGPVEALTGASLTVAEGEFVSFLGPTGCGKSTLLRVIADLIQPTAGAVRVRGETARAARMKNEFGFVFQEPALLPWRTARQNVELPLEVLGYPRREQVDRAEELLERVGLHAFRNNYPHELSGGMRQRVSIVRALAWGASILLMDEPFSALDEITRNKMHEDLLRLFAAERKTVLFVTHNISEAVYLSDRIVVMSPHPGRVKTILPVDLARPRHPEMRETMEFLRQIRQGREALGA